MLKQCLVNTLLTLVFAGVFLACLPTDCYASYIDTHTVEGRLQTSKGADIASADETTLGVDGNYFDVTGTITIDHITKTDWNTGSMLVLQFDASVTVTHNAGSPTGSEASILLSGAVNFSATADDTLQLVYDGVTFREVSRTVI